MIPDRANRSSVVVASAIYITLWIPALLLATLISLAGILTVRSSPMWSALSFLLALPGVLAGLKSFKISAISMVVLLAWDVVATSWPQINLHGFTDSLIDMLLLVSMGIVVLVSFLSPFPSVMGFVRHLRGH